MEQSAEVRFLIEKINERSLIKEQYASRYFVSIDGVDYTVKTKSLDTDPITITTDDKKAGGGGFIIPTGTGPVTFQGEILENEAGDTHAHMKELAARVFNADKTFNLPYTTVKYGIGYVIDLIVGYFGIDGSENHSDTYEMYITSDKISLSSEEPGALYIPVEFTQFLY